MANAATDPVWQAKVASEIQRTPGLQVVIEEKCSNCHMPAAHIHAAGEGATASMFGSGFLRQDHPLHAAAIDGVTCTLCHQIKAEKLGSTESFGGGYEVDTGARAPDRRLYGPYDNQVGQLMKGASGFDPVYGEQMTRSEFCATCHNLYTPFVDAQGEVKGEFPEQTAYTEWQASEHASAGTQCQDCHMPKADGVQAIASRIEGLPVRKPFFQHHFVGGNTLIPSILKKFGGDLEVTSTAAHFDATIARVHERIGEQSASLALKSLEHTGNVLTAQFEVKVLTGHKFPTSIPLRRTWLHVTVTDASGSVIFESGKWETDGKIAGNDADASAAGFEPHYDSINAADQVQIYEAILGDTEGQVTYTLLRAAKYLKDNRLLPKGFDKAGAAAEIAVYGAATDDASFIGGSDLVTYLVNVGGASGPFTVNAELLYEPLSYRFVQDLLSDGSELTNRFGKYYAAANTTPLLVSAAESAQTK